MPSEAARQPGLANPSSRAAPLPVPRSRARNIASWASICDDLGLPASHANRVGGLLRYIKGTGPWPDVLASLELLMTLLQQHPPPIDYQARRNHADQVDAFTEAIDAARRIHPSLTPATLLVRQLWERFTGSGIAYAPDSLRLDPATSAYAEFRRQLPVRDADLLHIAHRELQRSLQATGPATWTPSATAESEWPDVIAHLANCSHPDWG